MNKVLKRLLEMRNKLQSILSRFLSKFKGFAKSYTT